MENLTYLLSAYFHQDWNHAHDSWEVVVDEFATKDHHMCAAVVDDIDQLLAARPDDAELSQTLVAMGCDYDPPEGDREFLLAVRDRLRGKLKAQ